MFGSLLSFSPLGRSRRRIRWTLLSSICLSVFLLAYYHVDLPSSPDPKALLSPRPLNEEATKSAKRVSTSKLKEWHNTTSLFVPGEQSSSQASSPAEDCQSFPDHVLDRIQPVLRIGHDDVGKPMLGAQLSTVSACLSNLLIFSDVTEDVGFDRTSMDILADIAPFYENEDAEFHSHYARMQEQSGTLQQITTAADGKLLDKYKFLPMVERAWDMSPEKEWYIFYETDTYIFWDNTLRFLKNLDPDTPLYMGVPSKGRRMPHSGKRTFFGNGGPGILLSRAAIRKLLDHTAGATVTMSVGNVSALAALWIDLVKEDCCGDSVLGWALHYAGIPLSGYWPMFNPYPAHNIPYSENYWCQPILTLHKTQPEDVVDLWKWEAQQRRGEDPLLHRDIFQFKPVPEAEMLENWENGQPLRSEKDIEPTVRTAASASECREGCINQGKCLQWYYDGERCTLRPSFRHGSPFEPTPGSLLDSSVELSVSGWMAERIKQWREPRTCDEVHWVKQSRSRTF